MTVQEIGIVGLLAAAAVWWDRIRWWLAWPARLVFVTRAVTEHESRFILDYLFRGERPRSGNGTYSSEIAHVRLIELVLAQRFGFGGS